MTQGELPLIGPIKVDCPCNCGTFGVQKKKAWGDGLRHVKGCPCRRCKGSRHRPNARRRENLIARSLGGERDVLSGALSGADVRAGLWSFEETSNVAIVRGIRRWWTSKGVRTKVARLYQRGGEAHALVLSWDGRPQLVVTTWEDFDGQFGNQGGRSSERRGEDGAVRVLSEETPVRPGGDLPEVGDGASATLPPTPEQDPLGAQGRGEHEAPLRAAQGARRPPGQRGGHPSGP